MPCSQHPEWLHDAADCPRCAGSRASAPRSTIESPWDHNAECRYCDEQAAHRADCSWLMALEQQVDRQAEELVKANDKVETLRALAAASEADAASSAAGIVQLVRQVAEQEEVIRNQLRNLGDLRRQLTERETHNRDLVTQLDRATEAAKDMAAKIHFLVTWADQQGLLEDHVFAFPDGDVWEAKR